MFAIAEKVGRKVTIKVNGQRVTMYDLKGKASAIFAAATVNRPRRPPSGDRAQMPIEICHPCPSAAVASALTAK